MSTHRVISRSRHSYGRRHACGGPARAMAARLAAASPREECSNCAHRPGAWPPRRFGGLFFRPFDLVKAPLAKSPCDFGLELRHRTAAEAVRFILRATFPALGKEEPGAKTSREGSPQATAKEGNAPAPRTRTADAAEAPRLTPERRRPRASRERGVGARRGPRRAPRESRPRCSARATSAARSRRGRCAAAAATRATIALRRASRRRGARTNPSAAARSPSSFITRRVARACS